MDEYRRIFGYKSPLTTICDPEFVDYLYDMKKNYSIELELENLLGGKVKLVLTPCINKKVWRSSVAIKQCDHAFQNVQAHARRCMKEFVDGYTSCELVVCTSSLKAREYYASVPGLIVITRDLRGGIQIYTIPSQIISETIRATKMIDPVKKVESIFFDLAVDVCDDEPQGTANKRKRKGAGGFPEATRFDR